MRKWSLALLVLLLALALAGCGGPAAPQAHQDETESIADGAEMIAGEAQSLEALEGWWHREDEAAGFITMDFFYLDSAAATWTAYNSFDIEFEEFGGDLWMEGGTLIMDFPQGETVIEFEVVDDYDGPWLHEKQSQIRFRRGEEPNLSGGFNIGAIDHSTWEGKWYLNGVTEDEESVQYILFEGGSFEMHYVRYGEDTVIENGGYEWRPTTFYRNNSTQDWMQLRLGDGFMTIDLLPTDNLLGLLEEDGFHYNRFLKESAIGTPEGDETARWMALVGYWGEELTEFPSHSMKIFEDNTFEFYVYTENGTPSETYTGTWEPTADGVMLNYEDGTAEEAVWEEENLALPQRGATMKLYG